MTREINSCVYRREFLCKELAIHRNASAKMMSTPAYFTQSITIQVALQICSDFESL